MIEIKMPKEREEVKGDLISRQAVIYYIKPYIQEIITESGVDKNEHTNRMLRAIINGIETMPTGKQQPCEDAISRADVKKYLSAPDANGDRVIYESDLDLLPSVTPTRSTARWERLVDDFKKCSKCGKPVKFYRKHEYCPGCGARMQEVEE